MVALLFYYRFFVVVLALLVLVAGAFIALCDAVKHQAEAFPIIGTMNKGAWITILAVILAIGIVLMMVIDGYGVFSLFLASIGGTAVIVYWVDVRPKLKEIQHR